jgi:SAM-dependent MidA family methyltransferase
MELQHYLDRVGVRLEPGWRAEIGLRAVRWIEDALQRLERGFIVLIDYGHEARELYSAGHSTGTLTSFIQHRMASPADPALPHQPVWLQHAGMQDMTAHVDFTSARLAAEEAGGTALAFLDQTYFLLGLLEHVKHLEELAEPGKLRKRLALKTLLLPGGLGSTHKVLILGKRVGAPPLAGATFKIRAT